MTTQFSSSAKEDAAGPQDASFTALESTAESIPNCLYIGTSKAASTWIFDLLSRHPDIYVTPGKGLYFFDSHFDNGWDWYLGHFQGAGEARIVMEISHSYLFSTIACERIQQLNPQMKILACVREPVDRTFSDYLDHVKNGKFTGSFREALERVPSLIDRSRYATHLRPYLERFGRDRIHVSQFDDLAESPQRFADEIFSFLGVTRQQLADGQKNKIMPAGRPRSQSIMSVTKYISKRLKRIGLRPLMGRIKRSRHVRDLLYAKYNDNNKPRPSEADAAWLRDIFRDEVRELDRLLGTQLVSRWKYDQ